MPLDPDPPKRYFAIHYMLFRFLGLGWWHHPDEDNTTNFPGLYLYYTIITEVVCVFGFVSLESIDPFIGEKDLDRFMFSLSFVITHDLTLVKLFIMIIKNLDIQDIVHTLEIDMQRYYQNNVKTRRTIKISRVMTSSFVFFGWMTIANINVYGIFQDLSWKAQIAKLNDTAEKPFRALPQPLYVPWSYQTDGPFVLTILLESVGLLWTGNIILTIDTFIGSLIIHMSSQFEILQEAFNTAYDRTMIELSEGLAQRDSQYNILPEVFDVNLNDYNENIVRKHCTNEEIWKKFGKNTQELFSTTSIISQKDASSLKSTRIITSLAFFLAMVIQLGIQCFSGNALTDQASKVSEAIMQSKWERMPPRLRRLLVLAMMRAQRPLHLTAAGFATLNNDCFLAIMKAAYSYYAVLSQKQV